MDIPLDLAINVIVARSDRVLAPSAEECRAFITSRLGDASITSVLSTPIWNVLSQPNTFLLINVLPGSGGVRGLAPAPGGLESISDTPIAIGPFGRDHILLFPQGTDGLCPRSWMEAAWSYISHFRSGITFYPQVALLYSAVTVIGDPTIQPAVSSEIENALSDASWRQVERINCRSADALAQELNRRIELNAPFLGQSE